MAEETKEKSEKKKPIYKYGEHELDLGNYIHNLGTNLNSYLDTVKKDWSEGQKDEFTTAFDRYLNGLKEQFNTGEERFSTNNYGRIADLKGELSSIDDDGIDADGSEYYYNRKGERIDTKTYNSLKKRKQKDYKVFSANKEVANYFKLIGEKIKNKNTANTETPTTAFDFGADGFTTWHGKKYNPAGGAFDYQSILDLDKFENGVRGTTKRMGALSADLNEFADSLDPNKDYSKTIFKTHAGAQEHFRNLANRIVDADGLSEQDYLEFNKGGISRDALRPYTHTGEKLLSATEQSSVDAQKKAEADAAQKKVWEDEYKKMMGGLYDVYKVNAGDWGENNDPYKLGPLLYWNPVNGFDKDGYAASFSIENAPEYYNEKGELDKAKFDNYTDDYLTSDKLFTAEGRRALSGILGTGRYETIEAGPYKGKYYIPQVSDRTTNVGLVYDPVTSTLQKAFIGDIPRQAERIKRQWMEQKGIINREDRYKLFKEGGTINMMQLGGDFSMSDWLTEEKDKEVRERAKKEGRSVEQQKAGERKTDSDAIDPLNPNAGLKATDYARMGAAAADIASMISAFMPGAGTIISGATGVGSSLATFGADWAEDGLDWGDVGNLGVNLGMDVLGLIPGGGAASKGVKIAKTLGKYASRTMAAIAGMQGLANSNNIINSINKMTTDTSNMTVDDWRNVYQGFSLVMGGTAGVTRKVKKSIAEADMKAKANGAIAIEMVDKNNPTNKKVVAFDGEDAKAIREAQKSGDLKKLREVTVGKYEQFRDWDLATTGNVGLRSVKGDNGWQMPWGAKEGKARIFDMYGKDGKLYTDGGKWNADHEIAKPIDSATELQTATVDKAVEANKKASIEELKQISERLGKKVTDKEAFIKAENKKHADAIKDKQAQLKTATDNNDAALQAQYTTELADLNTKKATWEANRQRLQKVIDNIKLGKTKQYDQWKATNLQGTGTDAKLVVSSNPYNRPASQLAFEQILKDLKLTPNYFTYAKGGRLERVARFQSGGNASLKDVVNPGDWFNDMFMSSHMQNYFKTLDPTKEDTWKNFNRLQGSWRLNKANTGYSGQYAVKDKTDGVSSRQQEWNGLGINPAFESIKGLVRNGGTKDNPEGGYVDGVFGAQENFRHFGSKEYYDANPDNLAKAKEMFANMGFNYDLNTATNMYELNPLEAPKTEEAPVETPAKTVKKPVTTYTGTTDEDGGEDNTNGSQPEGFKNNLWGKLNGVFNGPLPYRFARLFVQNNANERMTDLMKQAEIPIYKNWTGHNDTIKSDLGAEMLGTKAKAELQSKARNMQTSDIDKYLAANMEATRVGLDFENEAMRKSDAAAREDAERAEINNYQDRVVATETSNVNRIAGLSTKANKLKHDAALVARNESNKAGVLAQFEQEAAIKQQENKAAQDALIRSDIHNSMLNKALTDGVSMGLTMEQVELLKQMKNGKTVGSFSQSEQAAIRAAHDIITEAETAAWAEYKGLSRYNRLVPYLSGQSNANPIENFFVWSKDSYKGEEYKEGGKIAVANVKARTADAERFQKMIIESMKNQDKAMDRLAKSMVNYVKDIMK